MKKTGIPSRISQRRENALLDGGKDYASKRAVLANIAASLFKEQGLEATTLAQIAERAEMDRATVYYYVGSKDELFQSLIEGSLDDNLSHAEEVLADVKKSGREKLTDIVRVLMQSFDRRQPQMFVFIQEQMRHVGRNDSKWAKDVRRKARRIETIVREIIESGMKTGKLRSDVDPRVATSALFGMVNWTHRWYRPGSAPNTAEEIAEMFSRIFFEGMQRKPVS